LEIPNRTLADNDYRFGFNGKEGDRNGEWGSAVHYDYGFRIYNPKIGKFLSVDPLTREYPWYTPYQFAGNKPIWAIDVDGLEEYLITYYLDNNQNLAGLSVKVTNPNSDLIFRRVWHNSAILGAREINAYDSNQPHRNYEPPPIRQKRQEDLFLAALRERYGSRMLNGTQFNCPSGNCGQLIQRSAPSQLSSNLTLLTIPVPTITIPSYIQQEDENKGKLPLPTIAGHKVTPGVEIDIYKAFKGVPLFFANERGDTRDPNDGSFPGESAFREIVEAVNSSKNINKITLGGSLFGGILSKSKTQLRLNRALLNIKSELEKMGINVPIEVNTSDIKAGSKLGDTQIRFKIE
jgi:RHS repeat-associated protein